jgi:hypothetical protein
LRLAEALKPDKGVVQLLEVHVMATELPSKIVAQSGTILACPVGQAPIEHRTGTGRVKLALLELSGCAVCPVRSLCPMTMRRGQPVVAFTAAEIAVAKRRQEQETPEFKERHKVRSGIEATNSELKRSHGLGKPRVRTKPRVAVVVRLKVLDQLVWPLHHPALSVRPRNGVLTRSHDGIYEIDKISSTVENSSGSHVVSALHHG